MADAKGTSAAASVAALLTAMVLGCGGGEPAPGSGVEVAETGGTGGAAGAGGSLALGNKAGTGGLLATTGGGGAGAGAPGVPLHVCDMPEQSCVRNVHLGDVVVRSNAEAMALKGVTSIMGNFTIDVSSDEEPVAQLADAFNCLEHVAGNVSIALDTSQGDSSLWGLRNLTTVDGNLTTQNVSARTYTDCGLARLQRVGNGLSSSSSSGDMELEGLGGELDLSLLTSLTRLRISNTELARIELATSGTLQLTSLRIEDNPYLTQIAGLSAVTVQTSSQPQGDVLRITNNPRLSQCDVIGIEQRFITAGAPAADVVSFGNSSCLPP